MRCLAFAAALCVQCAAVLLFARGFLLNRLELHDSADCAAPGGPRCYALPERPRKVVLVVIDALRVDFAVPLPAARAGERDVHYRNKMHFFRRGDGAARTFLFRADPPTTTSQRLKALTTGGLPAFIEAGRNFDSDSVLEDNLIHQLNRAGRPPVMLGDDTWLALYNASLFLRHAAFPSFDVRDLHTVDDGILRTLYDEVPRADHSLLIAHFLGVDHAGHRYHPDHPEMEAKLKQMDRMLFNVSALLGPDDLLLVMGDHGMTPEGDHGGGSDEETGSVLYAWSPRPAARLGAAWPLRRPATGLATAAGEPIAAVPQIDLVPTLALLLGVPIPYSNLGTCIAELLPFGLPAAASPGAVLRAAHDALRYNAEQVRAYVRAYRAARGSSFPEEQLAALEDPFHLWGADARPESPEDVAVALRQLQAYTVGIADLARTMWTSFDDAAMNAGLALSLIAAAALGLLARRADLATLPRAAWLAPGLLFAAAALSFLAAYVAVGLALLAFGLLAVYGPRPAAPAPPLSRLARFSAATVVLAVLGLFSNSYIVLEDSVAHFLLLSLAAACFLSGLQHTAPGGRRTAFAAFGAFLVAARAAQATVIRRTLGTHVIGSRATPVPLALTAASLVALFLLLRLVSHKVAACTSWVGTRLVLNAYAPLCSALCVLSWAADPHSAAARLAARAVLLLPFACGAGLAGLAALQPARPRSHHTPAFQLFRRFFTAAVLVLYPVILVGGQRHAHCYLLFAVQCVCGVLLLQRSRDELAPLTPALLLTLLSSNLFFATGHQNVFNLIDFNSGFIGLQRYNFVLSGLLVLLNTFGAHVVAAVTAPLVLLATCPQSRTFLLADVLPASRPGPTGAARPRPGADPAFVARGVIAFDLLALLLAAGSMGNVHLHRRHLMVWTIFTPKFCFDGVRLLLVAALSGVLAVPLE